MEQTEPVVKGLEGQQLEPSGRNPDGTDCAQLDADKV